MNELQLSNPIANIKQSKDVAGACKEIVSRSAIQIQGKKYVPVEGWMAIATAHGCNLSVIDVKQIDGGISAKGIVRRISDGLILGEAEGFVGEDEKMWANRPMYARRAMASTRAMSRAARSVFAHVVVLMDAGLSTTPAEEMEHMPVEKEINKPSEPIVKPVQTKLTSVAKQPIKSGLDETFSKYKIAISESLLQLDIVRFIKANQTFQKYIEKMDGEMFEEFEHNLNNAFATILDRCEDGSITMTKEIADQLIAINGHWRNQILSAIKTESKNEEIKQDEDYIF